MIEFSLRVLQTKMMMREGQELKRARLRNDEYDASLQAIV